MRLHQVILRIEPATLEVKGEWSNHFATEAPPSPGPLLFRAKTDQEVKVKNPCSNEFARSYFLNDVIILKTFLRSP